MGQFYKVVDIVYVDREIEELVLQFPDGRTFVAEWNKALALNVDIRRAVAEAKTEMIQF